jgi:hypothetical protein
MKARLARPLCRVTAILFAVPTVFPVAAGLATDPQSLPRWWGAVDVALAFLLALLAFAVFGIGQTSITPMDEHQTYRVYRVLIHSIFALILIFFLFGDHIAWNRCLTGFAWRGWLLLYVLPAWIAAYRSFT